MEKVSKKLGLPFVNTIEPLKESSSNNFNSLFLEAIHSNIKGHKMIARELLPELLRI